MNTVTSLAPSLDTERLSLRGHRALDLAESAAMWADSEVVRHIGGKPFTEDQVWTKLLRNVGQWVLVGFGSWVVREKESGRFVGEMGFLSGKRNLGPSFDAAPEVGWALAPSAQGRGFATEALGAMLSWGEAHVDPRTVCLIEPENARSLKLAARLGFRAFGTGSLHGDTVTLFERIAG